MLDDKPPVLIGVHILQRIFQSINGVIMVRFKSWQCSAAPDIQEKKIQSWQFDIDSSLLILILILVQSLFSALERRKRQTTSQKCCQEKQTAGACLCTCQE